MGKRREIDFVNVVLCLLVVFVHIVSRAVSALDKTSLSFAAVFVPQRLASFVVQGFIFLSALKYFMKDKPFEYGGFLKGRAKTVLAPYILWNVIYYFVLMPFGYFRFDLSELVKYIFLGNMISHFYFVVVIIQFYVLMPLWIRLINKISGRILIPLSLLIMIVFGQYMNVKYNDRIFFKYIFYWICGCYAGKNFEELISFLKEMKKMIIIIFLAAAVSDGWLTLMNASGIRYVTGLENIHIFYCFAAILFLLTIFPGKTCKAVDNSVFNIINRQSYNIYLSHCLLLYLTDEFAARHMQVGNTGLLAVRFVVCYGGTLLLWGAHDCIKRLKMHKSGC